MTSISDLPRELLHKIIPLTVEDSIAINNERSKRKILLNLALISKEFTIPAQRLLWENMTFKDVVAVQDLIGEGFGKDKVLKTIHVDIAENYRTRNRFQINLNMIENFLYGILEVHCLHLRFWYVGDLDGLKISNFFSIPSTKSLKVLMYNNHLEFTSEDSIPPPALTSFQCNCPEVYNDEVIAILKSSVNSLRSLSIFTYFSKTIYTPDYLPSFRLAAPNLTSLRISAFNNSVVEGLLPFCTSLKSLHLQYKGYDLPRIKDHLAILDSSVVLETLSLRWTSNSASFPSLAQLLESKPLKQLKYLCSTHFAYGTLNCNSTEVLGKQDESVREFEKRGIKLLFGTEDETRIKEEKGRQVAFNQRQVILNAALVDFVDFSN